MKKIICNIALLLMCSGVALAQKDVQAKKMLDEVSQKYKSYNAINTSFTMRVQNPQAGINETQNGNLLAQTKANKFHITLYNGSSSKTGIAQEIISDGKNQWTYLPKEKEVQVNIAGSNDDGLNPAQFFTLYEKGYKYMYTGTQRVGGKTYSLVELTPTDASKSIFKIKLLIDNIKKQIYSAQLFDKNGNRYNYTISSLKSMATVPASSFSFNAKAHPGVEVVDLR